MPKAAKKTAKPGEAERAAVRELVTAARARGDDLTRPDGLLKMLTATALQAALEEELTDAAGEVAIEVPKDRAGTFEPVAVAERQQRLTDVDAILISLYAKGWTTRQK